MFMRQGGPPAQPLEHLTGEQIAEIKKNMADQEATQEREDAFN